MKKVSVKDAVSMKLCHDITAMYDGFKGVAFKRGHIIKEEDIEKLLDYGKQSVYVWEENACEIHEEDAAIRMSEMTKTPYTHFTKPSEGKVLMISEESGMFKVDTELLKEINSIDDITISSVPNHYPVNAGDRLASMRIVPLVTKEESIEKAENLCKGKKLFSVCPYKKLNVGVVITGSEVYNGRIKDKFEAVVRDKMEKYPSKIVGVTICDDDIDMIVNAAKEHISNGADFLIFSGGMSVDPDDVTPSAIRTLGAEVISYGVPAQPGNMTLVAYLEEIPVLGVPGAAISLPTTIFDVLLPQIFSGEKIKKEELINLGDGGLCHLCKDCHWPNCTFGRY